MESRRHANQKREVIPPGVLWGVPGGSVGWVDPGVVHGPAPGKVVPLKTYRVTYRNKSGSTTSRIVKAPNSATIRKRAAGYIPSGKTLVAIKWIRTTTTAVNSKPMTFAQAQRKAMRDLQLHSWNKP